MWSVLTAWSLSRVQLPATPCTVAPQAPLSMGILHARILEWVAMPSSRGFLWSQSAKKKKKNPNVLAPETNFVENDFPMDQGQEDGFRMIQARYIYRALYFYDYCISSTLDRQALEPEAGDPRSRSQGGMSEYGCPWDPLALGPLCSWHPVPTSELIRGTRSS